MRSSSGTPWAQPPASDNAVGLAGASAQLLCALQEFIADKIAHRGEVGSGIAEDTTAVPDNSCQLAQARQVCLKQVPCRRWLTAGSMAAELDSLAGNAHYYNMLPGHAAGSEEHGWAHH